MSYQFYNDTATLKLIENGQAKNLSKSLISFTVQGDDLVIGYDSNENWLRIDYTQVTIPSELSAEALRNTLNSYLPQTFTATIDTSGLATETTLAGIKTQTDKLAFNVDRLKVDASVTLDGESTFGDNSSISSVNLSDVSTIVLASNVDRKEAYIVNATNKTIWVRLGSPAVYGNGIPLLKNEILIEDRYRGQITAIMNTGETGTIEVTEVTL